MIKIAICDDSTTEQNTIKERLEAIEEFKGAEYRIFSDGEEMIEEYKNGNRYDFVFLDVEMNKTDGIETGNYIYSVDSKAIIIFVTNYPQYAIDAFDCNAFHYILKNDSYERFREVLSMAYNRLEEKNQLFVIKCHNSLVTVALSEIYYVEYINKYRVFHTCNGNYKERGGMGKLAEKLRGFGFIQAHQSFIVNAIHVWKIGENSVTLTNGDEVMMSVRKKKYVTDEYRKIVDKM